MGQTRTILYTTSLNSWMWLKRHRYEEAIKQGSSSHMQAQLSQDLQRMTREKLEIQNQLAVVRGEQDQHQVGYRS